MWYPKPPLCRVFSNLKTDGSIYLPICKPEKVWRLISTESNVATSSSSSSSSSSLYINTSSTKTNQNRHIPTTSNTIPFTFAGRKCLPKPPMSPWFGGLPGGNFADENVHHKRGSNNDTWCLVEGVTCQQQHSKFYLHP